MLGHFSRNVAEFGEKNRASAISLDHQFAQRAVTIPITEYTQLIAAYGVHRLSYVHDFSITYQVDSIPRAVGSISRHLRSQPP